MPEQSSRGLALDEFAEREIGSPLSNAIALTVLGGEVEACRENWSYDESPEAVELVRLCAALDDYLKSLSITEDGALTLYRQCRRCSGAGEFTDEQPCRECAGRGSVHASEADL